GVSSGSIQTTGISQPGVGAASASVAGVGFAGQPNINLNATNFDFGNVVVGTTSSRSLVISNVGTSPLTGTLAASGAPFSVSSATFSVAPGGQQTVSVRFSPASKNDFNGTLTMNSSDPDAGRLLLNLKGSGIVPYNAVTPSPLDFGL